MYFDLGWVNSFQSEKTSVQVSAAPKLCSFNFPLFIFVLNFLIYSLVMNMYNNTINIFSFISS